MIEVENYETLVFDCDGVVLDSNKVKTNAFYQATLPYGEAAAQAMVDYHVQNGGVSRYRKFDHFLNEIAKIFAPNQTNPCMDELLQSYAEHVRQGLLECPIAPGLDALREKTQKARWLIVSGGDQSELRGVFAARGLDGLFDGGIFGSPDSKEEILAREIKNNNIRLPALFIGDSKYDYKAAASQMLDFVLLTDWTEVSEWQVWASMNSIDTARSIESVVEMIREANA